MLVYLFVLEAGSIGVFTSWILLDFSFSSYFSFFGGSEICSKNVSCDTADFMDRRANTKLALVESTYSHSGINQLGLTDSSFRS